MNEEGANYLSDLAFLPEEYLNEDECKLPIHDNELPEVCIVLVSIVNIPESFTNQLGPEVRPVDVDQKHAYNRNSEC